MISDNATAFNAAANSIQQLMISTTVNDALHTHGTEWRFIPKRAPWFGGWWERINRLTKTTIKKVLGRSFICYENLQAIVTEIEGIMNDRPLTYVTSDIGDPDPLTQAHLLYGQRITTLPYDGKTPEPKTVTMSDVTKKGNNAGTAYQSLSFMMASRISYVTARRYHKTTGNNTQTVQVGDIVQIYDESTRPQWKLCLILQLIYGNDGLARAAILRMSNGLVTSRVVVKLYPLEIISTTFLLHLNKYINIIKVFIVERNPPLQIWLPDEDYKGQKRKPGQLFLAEGEALLTVAETDQA
ncbi:uncharacterized protein LOC132754733 [Ruditapes philippinarum]|uniref:uncharacterized protein LOC132754733 n=1 Tax=Ruditapes philippinarum TaxID=129788 RepID=UPI00295ABBC3|nr:uncharacterized protein LOC132754733 [Ruditapes philippinarum]